MMPGMMKTGQEVVRTFQYREGPGGNLGALNGMIVEHVAGNEHEVHPEFGSFPRSCWSASEPASPMRCRRFHRTA